MVNKNELFAFFEEIAPKNLAEDYDNVGLLVEGDTDEIECIVLALDADEQIVYDAKKQGAQLILTHHPVMFRAINRLTEEEGGQRTLRRLLKTGIGLFAMHTNFDAAKDGLCDAFLDSFGEFSERSAFNGEDAGIGRVGLLKAPTTLAELLQKAKEKYANNSSLFYVGDEQAEIKKVAVCNGGGGDLLFEAAALGADVYISGDFKHHHARFAYENHINLIEINHYDAEIAFCTMMQKKLKASFGDRLKVLISGQEKNPWSCY